MCHYFGYFLGVAPRFLGIIFGYSRIFGYNFLVKFDLFKNNPGFVVLTLIFPSMTLWKVARRALVSYSLCRNVKLFCSSRFCSVMLVQRVPYCL